MLLAPCGVYIGKGGMRVHNLNQNADSNLPNEESVKYFKILSLQDYTWHHLQRIRNQHKKSKYKCKFK